MMEVYITLLFKFIDQIRFENLSSGVFLNGFF